MLARSAQGLYWMSRYLERAQHLCRLLRLQTESLVDRPLREIRFGWHRIYRGVDRKPPEGSLEAFDSEDYTLADSYTVADDLTFERLHSDSVWSCLALGRENARQMRQCVSAEMWTCLNRTYLRLRDLEIQNIWRTSPESFYAQTAEEIDTLWGVAAATMYRDTGWSFMQLGRAVERTQLSASLLLAQLAAERLIGESDDADWTSLLRCCHALETYNRLGSVSVEPDRVLDLLVTDPLLPASLRRALDDTAAALASVGPGPPVRARGEAHRLAGRLTALVHDEWPRREDREELLREALEHCLTLHQLVNATYFEYPVEELTAG